MALSDRPSLVTALVQAGMSEPEAGRLADLAVQRFGGDDLAALWSQLSRGVIDKRVPARAQQLLYDAVFAGWDESRGPRPAWTPTAAEVEASQVGALMRARGFADFAELHRFSVADPEAFWGEAIARLGVVFEVPPVRMLDAGPGPEHARWLPGARLNIAASCFGASPGAPAIDFHDGRGGREIVSYAELRARVVRVAAALAAAGFVPGDAIAIDMPMTARSVEIYLGIVWAGMTVVSIADSMAVEEIGTRLRIASARGVFTAHAIDRGGKRLPLYDKVVAAGAPRTFVLDAGAAPLRAGDLRFEDFLAGGDGAAPAPVIADAETVTNILFSSGTTGDPKAIPWTQLTPIKAAVDGALHLDVRAGDVVAWPTNLGWMMGPWLIYASLLNRATIALFGDAPAIPAFGRFVEEARVTMLGLVPSIVKTWRTDDRMWPFDWDAVRCFASTGEASNPEDYLYLMMLGGWKPVIEYCGGTEIGGGYITGTLARPASPATFSTPALGSRFVILDEDGRPADTGELFLVPPQLGSSQRLLNRDHHEVYYEGTPAGPNGEVLRRHGDQMSRLPGGYFRAQGRTDDTMNLGGIKVSSAEIERVLDPVPGVLRTAAIAYDPPAGGPSELVVYVVLRDPSVDRAALGRLLQDAIKTRKNPLFRISDVVFVDSLPVTASNKVMRRSLRKSYSRK